MNERRTTLKSIGDKFGVSVSTVSRILSGKAEQFRISKKTTDAITAEADRLGFSPNQIASSLRTRKTLTFGLIIPDISNSFFAAIARHVEMEAKKRDYFIILCESQENTNIEIDSTRLLQGRSVDGLIISPVGQIGEHLSELQAKGTPVVLVDRYFPDIDLPFVTSDNRKGARDAVTHLIDMGHTRIACIKGLPSSTANDREEGYREALEERGIDIDESLIVGDGFDENNGYTETKLLLQNSNKPTAIFSQGNLITFGVMRAMAEEGLSVSDDISIVSFDDYHYADYLSVPLTAVAQSTEVIGQVAVKLLFAQLDANHSKPAKGVFLPTKLIQRESVKNLRK